jgi:prepilin-type N-terminal cleavage/methylation domain-containing protein
MVKVKGFTITESIISLAVLSITITVASYLSARTLKLPNRTEIIQVSNVIHEIATCKTEYQFHQISNTLANPNMQVISQVETFKSHMQIDFQILVFQEIVFDHFILLSNED